MHLKFVSSYMDNITDTEMIVMKEEVDTQFLRNRMHSTPCCATWEIPSLGRRQREVPSFGGSRLEGLRRWHSPGPLLGFSQGGSIGVPSLASVLPMKIQDQFPLGLTDLILQSKGFETPML